VGLADFNHREDVQDSRDVLTNIRNREASAHQLSALFRVVLLLQTHRTTATPLPVYQK
jgi:hypothetical protein